MIYELGKKHGSTKIGHGAYAPMYEKYLPAHKTSAKLVVDIGTAYGASAAMWLDYFNIAHVVTLDTDARVRNALSPKIIRDKKSFDNATHEQRVISQFLSTPWNRVIAPISVRDQDPENVEVALKFAETALRYGNSRLSVFTGVFQQDERDMSRTLNQFIKRFGGIDVLFDDGGHTMEQQQTTLGLIGKAMQSGGFYFIEDLQTSVYKFWRNEFGASESGEGTTLTMLNEFIKTGKIKSKYIRDEDASLLENRIDFMEIGGTHENGEGIICAIKFK